MRYLAAVMLLALVPRPARAQVIDHTEARQHGGEEVSVQGPVAKVTSGGGGSFWLSLGQPHPKSTIVIVVPQEFARTLDDMGSYEGTVIRAYGRIAGAGSAGGGQMRGNGTGAALSGPAPRTPYLIVLNHRLQIISRADTASTRPPTR